ncbi:MAG: TonB-dependent receptor [Flavobacteriales bacterium]|nr:TonB-dependent receptor [Flavobacteriales bacterium]
MFHRLNCTMHHLACLFILAPLFSYAQPPMATLVGHVVDGSSGGPVPGASVFLVPGNISLTATTDSAGYFRMAAIPVGHYALRAAAVGFDTLEVPELWLRTGKQVQQRLELSPATALLGSVTVSAMAREQLSPLGLRAFTVEQSLRWPATFFDPGRLVAALPGVVDANDQANHLIIRGNSPNANAWILEGVEIVNPGHTGNAGTASDLPTLSGGGVNILSAQMLGTSQLLTGVLPIANDNALGGILDMHLRNGNMREQEWTAQAGLIGIDLSTEGPIGKNGRSSYLVNYRYSTVGILGALGVDLGDEAINFQDLSFHVTMGVGKRGEAHLFGLGGNSSNVFEAIHDTTQWEVDKDSRNIDYRSSMGAVGGSIRVPIGGKTTFTSTIAVSEIDQERTEERLLSDYSEGSRYDVELSERKLSGVAQVDGAVGARLHYTVGGSAMQQRINTSMDPDLTGWLIRPWLSGRWSFTDRLQATVGLAWSWFTFNDDNTPEPRATLEWRMPHNRKVALAYGLRSQLPAWQVMRVGTVGAPNNNAGIGFMRAQDVVLGYDHPVNDRFSLHAEAYYQLLFNVPVLNSAYLDPQLNTFSMVNSWDEPLYFPLSNTGTATNAGVEISMRHDFANNIFYHANVSLYSSQCTDITGSTEDSRWDGRYIINLFGGKEFKKVKEDRVRTWGISGRLNVNGGPRGNPINIRLSKALGGTVYDGPPWSEPLGTVYRIDLRVYLKKDRKSRTGMWSVDLQNVTNARNPAFRYFDSRKGEVITKYQLGIIPNLSYRIEF